MAAEDDFGRAPRKPDREDGRPIIPPVMGVNDVRPPGANAARHMQNKARLAPAQRQVAEQAGRPQRRVETGAAGTGHPHMLAHGAQDLGEADTRFIGAAAGENGVDLEDAQRRRRRGRGRGGDQGCCRDSHNLAYLR